MLLSSCRHPDFPSLSAASRVASFPTLHLLHPLPLMIAYGLTLTLGPTLHHRQSALFSPGAASASFDLCLNLSSFQHLLSLPLSFSAVASFVHLVSRQCSNQLGHAALLHLHTPLSSTSFLCALVPVRPSLWLIVICRPCLPSAPDAVKVYE